MTTQRVGGGVGTELRSRTPGQRSLLPRDSHGRAGGLPGPRALPQISTWKGSDLLEDDFFPPGSFRQLLKMSFQGSRTPHVT